MAVASDSQKAEAENSYNRTYKGHLSEDGNFTFQAVTTVSGLITTK